MRLPKSSLLFEMDRITLLFRLVSRFFFWQNNEPLLPLILIGFGANQIHFPKLGIILKWTLGNILTFFVTQAEELKHISEISFLGLLRSQTET
jgi:hypothetical protein